MRIMFAAAQTMARNSRLLPSRGAASVAVPPMVSHRDPGQRQEQAGGDACAHGLFEEQPGADGHQQGTEAEMMPAWAELVRPRAADSSQK